MLLLKQHTGQLKLAMSMMVPEQAHLLGHRLVVLLMHILKVIWFQTLGIKIQSVSNAIHQKTLRGGANFVVVSPETSTILESVSGYVANTGDASGKTICYGC